MAFIAPMVAATSGFRGERTVDPARVGLEEFRDHAQHERLELVRHYRAPQLEYAQALAVYEQKLGETVGLICTSTEVQMVPRRNRQIVVGLGLVARAASGLLENEVYRRVAAAEGVFAGYLSETNQRLKHRLFSTLIKNGPAETLARGLDTKIDASSRAHVAHALVEASPNVADFLPSAVRQSVALEDVVQRAVHGVVPVQAEIERTSFVAAMHQ